MSFDEDAPGLCALQVQYPDAAPAAIEYQGGVYVQSSRAATPAASPGTQVAASGDWTVRAAGASTLYLLTGSAMFTYRASSGC